MGSGLFVTFLLQFWGVFLAEQKKKILQ